MDFQRSSESVKFQESHIIFNKPFQKVPNTKCEKQHSNDAKTRYDDIICSKNNNFQVTDPEFQKLNKDIESIHSEVEQICNTHQRNLEFNDLIDSADNSELTKAIGSPEKEELSEKAPSDHFENSNGSGDSNSNKPSAEDVEPSDNVYPKDSRRTRRNSKRKRDEEFCPVCGVTVRTTELESHYSKEVENLAKIPSRNIRKSRTDDHQHEGISTTFVQVKSNRENRLSAKVERYAAKDRNVICCPVCNIRMLGNREETNRHVLNCINEDESSDELVIVDDNSFEEYEFADQTRVRAISFVPGGYKSLEGSSSKPKTAEDEDLNVDVDDTISFGKPQYTEIDVIHSTADVSEIKEIEKLRKAVLLDPNVQPHVIEGRKWSNENEDENGSESSGKDHVVSTLKDKIKDLEEQNRIAKCLICLEPYTKPVVSTTCWHVHCEECWLMTMGVKKLCPQCNMIVFPSDLRRIYL